MRNIFKCSFELMQKRTVQNDKTQSNSKLSHYTPTVFLNGSSIYHFIYDCVKKKKKAFLVAKLPVHMCSWYSELSLHISLVLDISTIFMHAEAQGWHTVELSTSVQMGIRQEDQDLSHNFTHLQPVQCVWKLMTCQMTRDTAQMAHSFKITLLSNYIC